jgi:NADH-quinone oxidoreductase subunit G
MAKIHVDGKEYEVSGADNLLQACLSMGLDIPYFCWHPALGSVGACRQCAVKQYRDADDKNGRIVMSCMTQASDNMYISIADAEAAEFREAIIEFLMTNHPHDCPVCEEGGHCHLQDMTVMTKHHSRSYRFDKRTHLNQDLGSFIGHEMNRCISCYRCVRYYRDYAGGTDLGVYGAAANVYFGRPTDGTLESEFSGNLTEVCPTGVFTDKTHSERYTRKWDMQFAPSICAGCATGCNVSPGERYGEIRRIENRYHGALNGYFLCDRGRFGYGYTNRKDRPRRPLVRREGAFLRLDAEEGAEQGKAIVQGAKRVLGIGSPRASLEANFALRSAVGASQYSSGIADAELDLIRLAASILRDGPIGASTIRDMEDADAVLVLGEDPTQTAPRVALAIRQAARGRMAAEGATKHIPEWQVIALADLVQSRRHPLMLLTPEITRLDDAASLSQRATPEQIAQLGFAVAHQIDSGAPAATVAGSLADAAKSIAATLAAASKPLVVSGTGAGSAAVMQAAAQIAWALKKAGKAAQLSLSLPEANSMGVALLDAPGVEGALKAAAGGEADVLVVLENDLYRRAPRALVDAALAKARVVVIDHQMTETAQKAALLLPAATVFESDGTFVNAEGRAQRYFQVFDPAYYDKSVATQESWRWCDALSDAVNWNDLDAITAACAAELAQFARITEAAPNAQFRLKGMKLARAPHRYSGRTAMRANLSVHEPRATQDADSALAFSMEGVGGNALGVDRPPELLPFAWAPGWNSPQAWNKFQAEVGGELKGGDSGEPLFTTTAQGANYFAAPAKARGADLQLLPLRHIFGSEEMSQRAEVIAGRAPKSYVALNAADAARLGLNDSVKVEAGGESWVLPVLRSESLAAGLVGLPVGLPGIPFVPAGAVVSVKAA